MKTLPLNLTIWTIWTLSIFLVLHFWNEKIKLKRFVLTALKGEMNGLQSVLELAGIIYSQNPSGKDRVFLSLPIFRPLGPTPISILRWGGSCSSLSRLLILGLREIGIQAHQITLYHVSGSAQHALVEVSLGKQHIIVDPYCGFFYANSKGESIGLISLRNGESPIFKELPFSSNSKYPAHEYYNFSWTDSKTCNWTKSRLRKSIYLLMRKIIGGRIDVLMQPWVLEWPQLILATLMMIVAMAINIAAMVIE